MPTSFPAPTLVGYFVAVGFALTASGNEAFAFCRTTTVPVVADFQPSTTKCWTEGVPLYWRNTCVGYSMNRAASRQVSFDDAANGMSTAFTKWTSATCATNGHGRSRVGIDVRDLGPVECGDVAYDQTGPNQNVIVFRDDFWPHNDSNNTLALTTVTFNPDTGEIYDADMEINTHQRRVTLTDPVAPDGYDFASIITHEAGHFLGLAHSGDSHATMFASYTPGATALRRLTSDDVAGVCAVYHADGMRTVARGELLAGLQCDPSPRRGFSTTCSEPNKRSCGGSAQIAATGTGTGSWVPLAGACCILLCARRRARASTRCATRLPVVLPHTEKPSRSAIE